MGRRVKEHSMITLFHLGWRTFLVAALILTIAWYAFVIPRLCKKQYTTGPGQIAEEEPETSADAEEFLGKAAMPEGVTEVAAHELAFVSRENQQGLVPDALQELKSIFHILETEGGNKNDFIGLFRLVAGKYRKLTGTPSQRALNEYIRENALFPISDNELNQLWN
jgi:hypothetical protein